MFRSRLVSLALVGLFLFVTACSSYTQIGLGEVADYDDIRVTTTDGERRAVGRIGLAVSESCAGATSRGRSARGLTRAAGDRSETARALA